MCKRGRWALGLGLFSLGADGSIDLMIIRISSEEDFGYECPFQLYTS